MKNIHLIPTDKPSRLQLNVNTKRLILFNNIQSNNESAHLTTQNIYITSDEEIKEGCLDLIKYKNHTLGWYLMIKNNSTVLIKYDGSGLYFNTETTKIFKIILTTDQDLIKDGVQVIYDGFLEWFVKNPNCEEVEVIKTFEDYTIVGGKSDEIYYKIIIPSEEALLQSSIDGEAIWGEEQKQHLIDMMKTDEELGLYEEPKQETIEEAAELYSKNISTWTKIRNNSIRDFIEGAKWQQERMYSKEEVEILLETLSKVLVYQGNDYRLPHYFEYEIEQVIKQLKK